MASLPCAVVRRHGRAAPAGAWDAGQARWRARADCSRRARASACLRRLTSWRRAFTSALAVVRRAGGRAVRRRLGGRQLDGLVVLQEVADDGRRGGLADERRRQHHLRDAEPVALDEPRQDGAQLVARRVVGMVAELLDAVGQRRVGEHEGEALHRPVDAPLGRRGTDRLRRDGAAGDPFDRLAVVVAEGGDDGVQLLVGGRPQCPVEQSERLQAGLHLVHGPRRYRRGGHPGPSDLSFWTGPNGPVLQDRSGGLARRDVLDGQAGGLPRAEAALDVADVGEAERLQRVGGQRRAQAAGAVDDDAACRTRRTACSTATRGRPRTRASPGSRAWRRGSSRRARARGGRGCRRGACRPGRSRPGRPRGSRLSMCSRAAATRSLIVVRVTPARYDSGLNRPVRGAGASRTRPWPGRRPSGRTGTGRACPSSGPARWRPRSP